MPLSDHRDVNARTALENARVEIGIHHHISGLYLSVYAQEMAWREDCRCESNGSQYAMVMGAVSVTPKCGYGRGFWHRRK